MLVIRGKHGNHALGDVSNGVINDLPGAAASAVEGLIAQTRWLWRCSSRMDDWEKRSLLQRLRLIREGLRYREALHPFQTAPSDSPLGQALLARPQFLELVVRPYQTKDWGPDTRLDMLRRHYEQVAQLDWPQLQDPKAQIEIMPMDDVQPDLRLVLDQPIWFTHEGPLVLNLFQGDERIYSLAFALRNNGGQIEACVGAIQGRSLPDVSAIYRELTRVSHGVRPRDLLIEMFQTLCEALGVGRITLVSDSHRHHRHAYFGASQGMVAANYDAIWADRGARRVDDATFELPLQPRRRTADEIAPRKRTQYRRRYDLLDRLSIEAKARIARYRTGAGHGLSWEDPS